MSELAVLERDTILRFVGEIAPDVKASSKDDIQDTIGLSSIQVLELIEMIEDEFDILFPLNDLADIRTVDELAAAVKKLRDV